MTEIRQALDELNARLVAAEGIGQALEDAAGEQPAPAWVYVYRDQLRAVQTAAEALETALNRAAAPGYGAQPHGDGPRGTRGTNPSPAEAEPPPLTPDAGPPQATFAATAQGTSLRCSRPEDRSSDPRDFCRRDAVSSAEAAAPDPREFGRKDAVFSAEVAAPAPSSHVNG